MQDRFKFRAWHKPTKQLFNVYSYSNDYVFGDNLNGIGTMLNPAQFEACDLMQCTGLKDRNGKLIYEGDILQQPQLPHKVVCEWYKDGYWLNGFMNGAKRELRNMHKWYEVIGNIYENPELLEEEND